MPDRLSDVINVKDWGAIGNNSNDDAAAIQAAIDYCISKGGGKVFFPPAVAYGIKSPLEVGSNNDIGVQLIGSGEAAGLINPISGYTDPNGYGYPISKGGRAVDNIELIEGLGISAKVTRPGVVIRSCLIRGTIDASGADGAYIDSCTGHVGGPAPATNPGNTAGLVGIYLGNRGVVTGTRIQSACDIAYALSGICPSLIACAGEDHSTVCRVGWGPAGETAAYGASVIGLQTERSNCGIDLYNCTGGYIACCTITGGAGVPSPPGIISALSWSGGTVTATTPRPHNIPSGPYVTNLGGGTYLLQIDVNSLHGNINWLPQYGVGGPFVSPYWSFIKVQVVNATTISWIDVPVNPGGFSAPGGQALLWNYPLQYGIRCRKVYQTLVAGHGLNIATAVTGVDLDYGGASDFRNNTCVAVNSTYGWTMPTSTPRQLAGWKFINVSGGQHVLQPASIGSPTSSMRFADLPGQAGVSQPGPLEGQEYDIIDGPIAALNNFNAPVTVGGGTNHVKVRHDGSGWKISG